jgi:hypothetical protein
MLCTIINAFLFTCITPPSLLGLWFINYDLPFSLPGVLRVWILLISVWKIVLINNNSFSQVCESLLLKPLITATCLGKEFTLLICSPRAQTTAFVQKHLINLECCFCARSVCHSHLQAIRCSSHNFVWSVLVVVRVWFSWYLVVLFVELILGFLRLHLAIWTS